MQHLPETIPTWPTSVPASMPPHVPLSLLGIKVTCCWNLTADPEEELPQLLWCRNPRCNLAFHRREPSHTGSKWTSDSKPAGSRRYEALGAHSTRRDTVTSAHASHCRLHVLHCTSRQHCQQSMGRTTGRVNDLCLPHSNPAPRWQTLTDRGPRLSGEPLRRQMG